MIWPRAIAAAKKSQVTMIEARIGFNLSAIKLDPYRGKILFPNFSKTRARRQWLAGAGFESRFKKGDYKGVLLDAQAAADRTADERTAENDRIVARNSRVSRQLHAFRYSFVDRCHLNSCLLVSAWKNCQHERAS